MWKAAELKKDARWRLLIAALGLSLASMAQYIEHSDCAERKFTNDTEPRFAAASASEAIAERML